MTVTQDVVVTDHGKEVVYGVIHKRPGVIIIPWDGHKFTIIGHYRYPVDHYSWEFPAGHYEHNSIKDTASTDTDHFLGWSDHLFLPPEYILIFRKQRNRREEEVKYAENKPTQDQSNDW